MGQTETRGLGGHSSETKLEILVLLTLWNADDYKLHASEVCRRVEEHYGGLGLLTAADLHGDVKTERWLPNALRFARNRLVKQGKLKPVDEVGRGVWALTEEGRAFLADPRGAADGMKPALVLDPGDLELLRRGAALTV